MRRNRSKKTALSVDTPSFPSSGVMTTAAAANSLGPRADAAHAGSTSPTVLASQLKLVAARRSPMSPATREQLFGGLPFTKLMQHMQSGKEGNSGRLTSPDLKTLNLLIHSRMRSTSMRDYSSFSAYSDYLDR